VALDPFRLQHPVDPEAVQTGLLQFRTVSDGAFATHDPERTFTLARFNVGAGCPESSVDPSKSSAADASGERRAGHGRP